MKNIKNKMNSYWYLLIILVIGLFITIPQLHHHITIIGSDGLFHFNRIYDAAMQIKHHNFSYFIQLYGFSNSGRMVTSVYSPFLTYLLGLLLLICGSFYKFEIVTRFLFFILTGLSMNYGLKLAKVKNNFMIQLISIIYAFSPAVIRWNAAQNFTSIGAMYLPLIIGLGMRMINNKERPINWLQLGLIMAVVVQSHLATAIQSTVILGVYAVVALFVNRKLWKTLIKNGIYAILLCLTLSANVIAGMIEMYRNNYIVPIVKFNFVDGKGLYNIFQIFNGKWVNLFFLMAALTMLVFFFKKMSTEIRVSGILSIVLFLCSTSIIIDWPTVMKNSFIISSLLQFPSRLIGLAIALSMMTIASIGDFEYSNVYLKQIRNITVAMLLLFLVINMRSNLHYNRSASYLVLANDTTTIPNVKRTHKILNHVTKIMSKPIKAEDINYLTKSTSDYLPANTKVDNAVYWDNENKIIQPTKRGIYEKKVGHHKIIVSWKSKGSYDNLPIAYYSNSQFILNGSKVYPKSANGIVRVPKVKGKIGQNIMEVSYKPNILSEILLALSILSWICLIVSGILIKIWNLKR